jgi:hypothetical protein
MKIVMEKSEWVDDWYLIVKVEHDGEQWMEKTGPNTYQMMCSERISDADIEGSEKEMLQIAEGILNRSNVMGLRRCAVRFESDGVHFWSPRNSRVDGVVSIEEADELAGQIIRYFEADKK